MTRISSRKLWFGCLGTALGLAASCPARAADLNWKGYDWQVTAGEMAGVAVGAASNVTVDASGYLHLAITKNGSTWTASELFTTQKLGFGTYQWQIEGPIDTFDQNNVLGLFPYGPAAGIGADGTNEIDIEFSRWGQANAANADFTDYPNSGDVVGETAFTFSLGGSTSSTARFVWNATSIESSLLKGHQAIGSDNGLLKKWKYAPDNPSVNIPQQALPLGINLWCFEAPPSDGQNVAIVIRDFQFVKEGDPLPSSGGTGGGGTGSGGSGGANAGAGGGTSMGGSAATGGATNGGSRSGGGEPPGAGANFGGGGNTGGAGVGLAGSATTAGAGVAGSGVTQGGSANNANPGAANAAEHASSSGCVCSLPGASPARDGWAASVGVGLALLALGRRRRQGREDLEASQ